MDATAILTAIGVIVSNVLTIITLYIHLDNKTEATLNGMRAEMRDFHNRIIKIEERKLGG
jgi:hypothetical protein